MVAMAATIAGMAGARIAGAKIAGARMAGARIAGVAATTTGALHMAMAAIAAMARL